MKQKERIRLWAVVFWLTVWQLAAMWVGRSIFLVSPVQAIQRLAELIPTLSFRRAVIGSFLRISTGFLLALALSVLLSAAAAVNRRIRELLQPLMLCIRSVPVVSFIILALICFSSRYLSVFISFLMVLPIIYTSILSGLGSVDRNLTEMASVFRMKPFSRVRYILLPAVLPSFRAGITTALGLCWKSGIAAEVIGMPQGSIGERLQQAKVYLETADLFAWTLTILLLSMVFEKLILHLTDRLTQTLCER